MFLTLIKSVVLSKMDYACGERRNKRKDKRKERKKHPYRTGGAFRARK